MIIRRHLHETLRNHLDDSKVTIVVGPRQAGKTTLLKTLMEELGEKPILYLDLDNEKDQLFFSGRGTLRQKIRSSFKGEFGYVFVDEFQRKEKAGQFVADLFGEGLECKFILASSEGLGLRPAIFEALNDLSDVFELPTLSFLEFSDYRTNYRFHNQIEDMFQLDEVDSQKLLEEYMDYGGYPRVVLEEQAEEKVRILGEIFKEYLEKDVHNLFKVGREHAFARLVKLMATRVGRLINYTELARELSVSLPTVKQYLRYLEQTFVVEKVVPYYRNSRKEISKTPICYFNDLGLRSYLLKEVGDVSHSPSFTLYFQNMVFNTLLEKSWETDWELHFWRTKEKMEVDFVLVRGDDVIPIEACASALEKPMASRCFKQFLKRYWPDHSVVINLSLHLDTEIKGIPVRFVPFRDIFVGGLSVIFKNE